MPSVTKKKTLKVLGRPLTPAQVLKRHVDERIVGVAAIGIGEIVELGSRRAFYSALSRRLVDRPEFAEDVRYKVVGHRGDKILFEVSVGVEQIVNLALDALDEAEENRSLARR